MSSEDRFGYEWRKYSQVDPNYETQFSQWVYPLTKEDFAGKRLLDAGCGMGRNSYWAKKWGVDYLVAFDYDRRSVEITKNNLKEFNNIRVEFKSIYDIEWRNEFDIVFCLGVIHHLEDPQKAIRNLIQAIKSKGIILVRVYSYEGNELLVKFVNPIRKGITSKLPLGITHFISYFFSVPLWIFIKIFKGPTPYFKMLSKFKFWHVHSIVFDQLIPRIAHYWRREEALSLLSRYKNLENVQIYPVNNNSWTIFGIKK